MTTLPSLTSKRITLHSVQVQAAKKQTNNNNNDDNDNGSKVNEMQMLFDPLGMNMQSGINFHEAQSASPDGTLMMTATRVPACRSLSFSHDSILALAQFSSPNSYPHKNAVLPKRRHEMPTNTRKYSKLKKKNEMSKTTPKKSSSSSISRNSDGKRSNRVRPDSTWPKPSGAKHERQTDEKRALERGSHP